MIIVGYVMIIIMVLLGFGFGYVFGNALGFHRGVADDACEISCYNTSMLGINGTGAGNITS